MLVNMSDSEVQLLDIDTAEVVRRFMGQKQGNYIIRSTFGGAAENFVVSGSEGTCGFLRTHEEPDKLELFFANLFLRFPDLHLA